jgi:hypothetical protein
VVEFEVEKELTGMDRIVRIKRELCPFFILRLLSIPVLVFL